MFQGVERSNGFTRRRFLVGAATSAAGVTALPACSNDDTEPGAPSQPSEPGRPTSNQAPLPPLPERWSAQWVEPTEPDAGPTAQRPAYHLAGELNVAKGVQRAVLYATARGIYEAFINGERVGDFELTPGFTAYHSHLHVQTFDITDLVLSGGNVVGATLSDGWWRGRSSIVRKLDAYGPNTALLAEIHLTHDDGTVTRWGTDGTWRSTASHILGADLVAGEVHDLGRRVDRWAEPGTDRSGWAQARVASDQSFDTLVATVGPPTRRVREIAARSVTTVGTNRHVVDFGENSNGWIRLTDLGPAGTELTITYGEALDAAGDVTQSNLAVSPLEQPTAEPLAFQTDRVISGGAGSAFEPRHSTKGFRYVRIDGHPGPLETGDVTSVVVHSDLARIGSFTCSDDQIVTLQEVAERSFLTNACEIPTDCPTRERAGWVGDWQIYVATAAETFDVGDWSQRWLRDLAADQYANGCVTNIVPDPSPEDPSWKFTVGSAGWGDAVIHVPWELHRATGRTDILEASFEPMRRWLDFVATAAAGGRFAGRVERNPVAPPHEQYIWDSGWQWGEWLEPGDKSAPEDVALRLLGQDHGIVATAYYQRSARELAEIAGILGRDDLATEYRTLADATLAAWRTEFLDASGMVTVPTQANLVRAIAFELAPPDSHPALADALVERIREAGTHLGTGFLSTPYLLPVLADTGHLDVAYELLFQRSEPSWLVMLDRGATTIWEQWDGVRSDGSTVDSLNHYSKGAVVSFLRRYVAGLQILEPGYRRFLVAPRPGGGITSASTTHDSTFGRIEVSWELTPDGGSATVIVPDGTTAEWRPPTGDGEALTAGRHDLVWAS